MYLVFRFNFIISLFCYVRNVSYLCQIKPRRARRFIVNDICEILTLPPTFKYHKQVFVKTNNFQTIIRLDYCLLGLFSAEHITHIFSIRWRRNFLRNIEAIYKFTWRHNPEDHSQNFHRCEKLKPPIL